MVTLHAILTAINIKSFKLLLNQSKRKKWEISLSFVSKVNSPARLIYYTCAKKENDYGYNWDSTANKANNFVANTINKHRSVYK